MVAKVIAIFVLALAAVSSHAASEVAKSEKSADGRLFFLGTTDQSVTISTSTLTTLGLIVIAGILLALVLTSLGVAKEGDVATATGYAETADDYSVSGSSSYAVQRSLEEAEKKYR
ncbi:uncharacterized protein LOC135199868 isoform X2 [Macrobrachium nipponense]|uniref:uncharacterized protein LOC135199868 isoform X2 n=1 Tax=Macrobrachium nipponense TaxID=159736 RepID=UPI0030C7B1E6